MMAAYENSWHLLPSHFYHNKYETDDRGISVAVSSLIHGTMWDMPEHFFYDIYNEVDK